MLHWVVAKSAKMPIFERHHKINTKRDVSHHGINDSVRKIKAHTVNNSARLILLTRRYVNNLVLSVGRWHFSATGLWYSEAHNNQP